MSQPVLLLFVSTFLLVFFLGLQSLNVNGGHYWAAFATSAGIGVSQLVLYKLVPDASAYEIAAYLAGGPLGIVASMRAHAWLKQRAARKAQAVRDLTCAVCRAELSHPPEHSLANQLHGAAFAAAHRERLTELDIVDERCARHARSLKELANQAAQERRIRYKFERECG